MKYYTIVTCNEVNMTIYQPEKSYID